MDDSDSTEPVARRKPETEMTIAELIQRFEGDILYDCHSFRARYSRSAARKELISRGNSFIPHVEEHMLIDPRADNDDLKHAFDLLHRELCMCAG